MASGCCGGTGGVCVVVGFVVEKKGEERRGEGGGMYVDDKTERVVNSHIVV